MMTVAMIAFALTACNNNDFPIVQPEQKTVKLNFTVGDFPVSGWEASSRSVGFNNTGKTAWEVYDQLMVQVFTDNNYASTPVASTYLTLKDDGNNGWTWTMSGELNLTGEVGTKYVARAVYAPGYGLGDDGNIELVWEDSEGGAEIIESDPVEIPITDEGTGLVEKFHFGEDRSYSRLRIAAEPEAEVYISVEGFKPLVMDGNVLVQKAVTDNYTRGTDGDGNVFLYGSWEGAKIDIQVIKEWDEFTDESYDYTVSRVIDSNSTPKQGYVINARLKIDEWELGGIAGINIPMSATPEEITDYLTDYLERKKPTKENPLDLTIFGGLTYYNEDRMGEAQRAVRQASLNYISNNEGAVDYYASINLRLPNVSVIDALAFNNMATLKSVTLDVAYHIAADAFSNCYYLQSVSLPLVVGVEDWAFTSCIDLQSLSLPEAKSISACAFWGCTDLEDVFLPKVTSLGDNAFTNCRKLKTVVFQTPVTEWGNGVFYNLLENTTLTLHKDQEGAEFGLEKSYKGTLFKEITKYEGE